MPAAREPRSSAITLTARIAHGGMATIYAGTLSREGAPEPVAIKVLHPHLAEDPHIQRMFLHEAELATRLHHPNVVAVMGHGEDPTHGTWIALEYVEGGDLAKVLRAAAVRGRRLPPTVVARLVVDLCRGLDAAHELLGDDGAPLHLIHRDVSPHNLLIGVDGIARLIDFGIARSDERYTMTRPGQLKGKLAYMAPEQLAHEEVLDRRLDIFSAGVVLWETLLSRRLFRASDEVSIMNEVLHAEITPPSRFFEELAPFDPVVARALARTPDERFATADAMAGAVEGAAEALGGLATRAEVAVIVKDLLDEHLEERAARLERASLTPPAGPAIAPAGNDDVSALEAPAARRSPIVWLLAAGLAVALIALGVALLWPARETTTTVFVHEAREPTPATVRLPLAEPEPETDPGAEPTPSAAPPPAAPRPAARPRPARRRARRPPESEPLAPSAPPDDLEPNPYGD